MKNFEFEIKNEVRPCYVDGEKALFHRWIEKDKIIMKANGTTVNILDLEKAYAYYERSGCLPNFATIDKVKDTLGIIEYENGEVSEVEPIKIQFADNKIKEYAFD